MDSLLVGQKLPWRPSSRVHLVPLVWLLAVLCVPGIAQTPEELFSKGNEFYRKGQFDAALKEYNSILSRGFVSPELYFNTGNAYFRLNKISPAILAYERALRSGPHDPDVVHNLKLANLRTMDRIDAVPELFVFQWLRSVGGLLSRDAAEMVFMFSWLFLFVSLSVLSVLKRVSFLSLARRFVFAALLGVVISGGFMSIHSWEMSAGKDQAVIIVPVVTAKSSPDEMGADAFVVHEGLKVRTSDYVADWTKITLPDGKVGWIRSNHCEWI